MSARAFVAVSWDLSLVPVVSCFNHSPAPSPAVIRHGIFPGTIAEAHADEVLSLMPLGRPFDGFVEHSKRVHPSYSSILVSDTVTSRRNGGSSK